MSLPVPAHALEQNSATGRAEEREREKGGERGEEGSDGVPWEGGEEAMQDGCMEADAMRSDVQRGRRAGNRESNRELGALAEGEGEGRDDASVRVGGVAGSEHDEVETFGAGISTVQEQTEGEGNDGARAAVGQDLTRGGVMGGSLVGPEKEEGTAVAEALREGERDSRVAEERGGGGVRVEIVEALVPGIDFCNHGESRGEKRKKEEMEAKKWK